MNASKSFLRILLGFLPISSRSWIGNTYGSSIGNIFRSSTRNATGTSPMIRPGVPSIFFPRISSRIPQGFLSLISPAIFLKSILETNWEVLHVYHMQLLQEFYYDFPQELRFGVPMGYPQGFPLASINFIGILFMCSYGISKSLLRIFPWFSLGISPGVPLALYFNWNSSRRSIKISLDVALAKPSGN